MRYNSSRDNFCKDPFSISPPGKGEYAPAFRHDLSTDKMWELCKKGYLYKKIGQELGCSPNTVRNRLMNGDILPF